METFRNIVKTNRNVLILLLLEITVGVLLFIDAQSFANLIFIIVGAFFIIKAVQGTVEYFRTPAEVAVLGQGFATSLVCLAIGCFLVFQSQWLVSLFPALAAVFGVALILMGFSKVQWAVDLLRVKNSKWYFPAIGATLAIVCGAIICSGTFSNDGLLVFSAIAMLAGAVIDIVSIVMAVKGRLAEQAAASNAAAANAPAVSETDPSAIAAAAAVPVAAGVASQADAAAADFDFDEFPPVDDAPATAEPLPVETFDADWHGDGRDAGLDEEPEHGGFFGAAAAAIGSFMSGKRDKEPAGGAPDFLEETAEFTGIPVDGAPHSDVDPTMAYEPVASAGQGFAAEQAPLEGQRAEGYMDDVLEDSEYASLWDDDADIRPVADDETASDGDGSLGPVTFNGQPLDDDSE